MTKPCINIPLIRAFPSGIIPFDLLNPSEDLFELLNRVIVTRYDEKTTEEGSSFEIDLSVIPEAVFELPGLEGFSAVFGGTGGALITVGFDTTRSDSWILTLKGSLRIRFPREWLRPVVKQGGKWVDDPLHQHTEILVNTSVTIDQFRNVSFDGPNDFTLNPSMIADTGFVIEGTIAIDFSENQSLSETLEMGLGNTWRGVVFKTLKLYLPDDLDVSIFPEELVLTNFHIGSGGISGSVSGIWSPTITGPNVSGSGAGTLFGMKGGISSISLEFVRSILTETEIKGKVLLPFFDEPVDVSIGIGVDGNFYITVADTDEDGIYMLKKEGILEAKIETISFEKKEDLFIASLSGNIRPLIGGINWPEFEVEKLSIDSEGNVHIDGGWIDVSEKLSFSFHGFKMELTQIGFGSDEDKDGRYKWIGFSGGIQLIEGLKAGGSVEGLRIKWWEKGGTGVELKGVGVNFEIPDVLKFDGKVAFLSDGIEGFKGNINLDLISIGLKMNAVLVVAKRQNEFKFFYIYLDAELPEGIPLGSSGVGLYGMAGLFAYNMEPGKEPDEEWYKDWYKKLPEGVTRSEKWKDQEDSLALGGGITLGTITDNGYSISAKTLLVITLPGPIILIEGKANFLKKRKAPSDREEGAFRALAVIDNRAGQLLINIEATYKYNKKGEVIDIHGGAEAFFDYRNVNNWHLYLGEKDPREKRIRAKILTLFGAETYFMLEPTQLQWGFWFGFDEKWKFGPVKIVAAAWAEGAINASWKPEHFWGKAWLHGELSIKVFRFSFGFYLDAGIEANTPTPYYILAAFKVGIELPWPLPDFKIEINLKWEDRIPPPWPLPLEGVAVGHEMVQETVPLLRNVNENESRVPLLLPNYDTDDDGFFLDNQPDQEPTTPADADIPVVPLDARPILTFGKPVEDIAHAGLNSYPLKSVWQKLGHSGDESLKDYEYKFELTDITLEKCTQGSWAKAGYLSSIVDADQGIENSLNAPTDMGKWVPWTPPEALLSEFPHDIILEEPFYIVKLGERKWKFQDKNGVFSIDKGTDCLVIYRAIYGTWLPAEDGEGNPTQTKLKLWTRTPFSYTRFSTRDYEDGFMRDNPNYPCVPEFTAKEICVGFDDLDFGMYGEEIPHSTQSNGREYAYQRIQVTYGRELEHHGIRFNAYGNLEVVKISFKEPVGMFLKEDDGKPALRYALLAYHGYDPFLQDLPMLFITLPDTAYKVRLEFYHWGYSTIIEFLDAYGNKIKTIESRKQNQVEFNLEQNHMSLDKGIKHIVITLQYDYSAVFLLFKICYTPVSEHEREIESRTYKDLRQTTATHWYNEGDIFEPYTKYRLKITTKITRKVNDTEEPKEIYEYAFFRTEGPPGFAKLVGKEIPIPEGG